MDTISQRAAAYRPPALKSFLFALFTPLSIFAQSVTTVVFPNDPAPGGGTYSGVSFSTPTTLPDGGVFFTDSSIPDSVGFPGSLGRLNIQASTISGLVLAPGESLNTTGLTFLSSPSPGYYFVKVPLVPAAAGHVIIGGTPGNFTKIIKSGDTLPGTSTQWSALRFSPTIFIPTSLNVTRAGHPVINTITADDSVGHVGIYRNSAWEATQMIGMDVPGFAAGSRFRPGTIDLSAGNGNGQFLISTSVFAGPLNSSPLLGRGAFVGQNGSLQMIAKERDILPGDSRQTSFPTASSINDSGTVALSGFYLGGESAAGWVYRWSAAGGASKVISEGDALPSVGPKAVFYGCNTFQLPLINASGAMLFVGDVNINGNRSSSIGRRSTLLYQSGPGAPIQMVARAGDTITGLPSGSVVGLNNSDVVTFNDAGQVTFNSLTTIPGTGNSGTAVALFGGLAPNVSVIARVGTPLNVNGRNGSSVFSSIISDASTKPNRVTGDFAATLSSAGDIYFRGFPAGTGVFFGQSGVFRAQLSGTQTGTLSPQVITFPPPRNVVAGSSFMTLAATSSSGLPVTFSLVSGPATLAGNTLSFSASTGEVVLRANQAGNASFLAAPTVEWKFDVVASAASLPYVSPALLVPLALPGNPAPGGGTYSGVETERPLVTGSGEVTFKDALTADVINGEGTQARLNLYQSTVTGLTLNAGEQLDRLNPTILSRAVGGNYFIRVPITTSTTPNEVLITGTPGSFSKILRTGDSLPGTTSIWTYDQGILPLPKTTRGGAPIVYATSTNGLSSHIGIYRNGAWENTQILGTAPPNFGTTARFSNSKFTAANQSGQFVFSSEPFAGSTNFKPALFLGQNGIKQIITSTEVGVTIGGDLRQVLTAFSYSINSSGTALIHGDYRQVSGNSNQGGFLYRWSSAGGFSKIAVRGDFLPNINSTAKFYAATSEPLINDAGAVLFFATVDLLGTGSGNYNGALLYQAAPGAVIQKVAITGESIPGLVSGTFSLIGGESLQLNEAGQFALFTSNGATIYGGTAPSIAVIASARATYIEGVSGPKFFSPFTVSNFNSTPLELNGVAGEFGARISNDGLIPFRSSYSGIGITTNDNGVFVAKLNGLPAPVPVAQIITFSPPVDQLINSSFNPAGTANSGLPVNYQIISGPAIISGGNISTTGTAGLVTVRASQAGNASFLAATSVDRTFRVVATASELSMTSYLAAANVPPESRLPNLDLDGDGLSNLLEFALGAAPLISDAELLPSVKILNGQFCFTYTRAQQASINYRVTTTPDLASLWSASGVDQGTVSVNGLTVASIPAAASSRFLRLEVTLKP